MVLEKILESPLDCKEIQLVHPKGDQSRVFTGGNDVEAKTPILWPPDAESWLIWKDPDAGKDWGHDEKGMTEDEIVGWHHRLNGHGFGWTPGVGDGQGGLVYCDSRGRKESGMTERLNWAEIASVYVYFFSILKYLWRACLLNCDLVFQVGHVSRLVFQRKFLPSVNAMLFPYPLTFLKSLYSPFNS